jgi:hypothetical protein
MVSYMTAEADQLLRREGPLWESLETSVLGGIYEGAAALSRENAEQINRMVARGGNARRQGVAAALKIRAQEKVNSERVGALRQANMALNLWARDNARNQLAFNQAWTDNVGGIRDTFNNAITQVSQFYAQTIMPTLQSGLNAAAANSGAVASQANTSASSSGKLVAGLSGILGAYVAQGGRFGFGDKNTGTPTAPGSSFSPYSVDTSTLANRGG